MSELSPMADRILEATIEQGEPIRVKYRLNGGRVDAGTTTFASGNRREMVIAKAAVKELEDARLIRAHALTESDEVYFGTPKAYKLEVEDSLHAQHTIMAEAIKSERVWVEDSPRGPGKCVAFGDGSLGDASTEEALLVELAMDRLTADDRLQPLEGHDNLYEPTAQAWQEAS